MAAFGEASRRELLALGAGLGAALVRPSTASARTPAAAREARERLFEISLAQWSLHRTIRAGKLAPLDFPRFAREEFDIQAVEYVNQFFPDKAVDFAWLEELRSRAGAAGVKNLLIMIDREGELADAVDDQRRRAIENHFKWIAAAKFLGCHSIRVNAGGADSWEPAKDRAADSLRRLGDLGEEYGIDVIVENHGGLSSNGKWLAEVIQQADHPRVGTLPDFGNFKIAANDWYDRYQGVAQLMPWARGVSAKSHAFDERGEETSTDYHRMLRIVVEAGYRGHVGVEWEGENPGESEGIRLTQRLLERVRTELEEETR